MSEIKIATEQKSFAITNKECRVELWGWPGFAVIVPNNTDWFAMMRFIAHFTLVASPVRYFPPRETVATVKGWWRRARETCGKRRDP